MKFIADLHVHSKYSIATAKNLDLENLYIAAQKKGITVVGTGDFTHRIYHSFVFSLLYFHRHNGSQITFIFYFLNQAGVILSTNINYHFFALNHIQRFN